MQETRIIISKWNAVHCITFLQWNRNILNVIKSETLITQNSKSKVGAPRNDSWKSVDGIVCEI
jgi:hypothetical protein